MPFEIYTFQNLKVCFKMDYKMTAERGKQEMTGGGRDKKTWISKFLMPHNYQSCNKSLFHYNFIQLSLQSLVLSLQSVVMLVSQGDSWQTPSPVILLPVTICFFCLDPLSWVRSGRGEEGESGWMAELSMCYCFLWAWICSHSFLRVLLEGSSSFKLGQLQNEALNQLYISPCQYCATAFKSTDREVYGTYV